MKTKKLLLSLFLLSVTFSFSQKVPLWEKQTISTENTIKEGKEVLPTNHTFSLDIERLKAMLVNAPDRSEKESNIIVSFPNANGVLESFRIFEASNMDFDLQERFPNIRAYMGQGVKDGSAVIRFSVSPLGFQSMVLSGTTEASFIEALTNDNKTYAVFNRSSKSNYENNFECATINQINNQMDGFANRDADDAMLRTFRLAMSATGEYTNYFGGVSGALAAINATMTRVNGVFENDFNVTMQLINNTTIIYTNAATDPYSGNLNTQLQSTLTSVVGEANYDIGHLVGQGGSGGNAGCIGCVCVNGQKGSGYTSYNVPSGDSFDIDYVAHEMGHQFGGNHTFTTGTGGLQNEGTGVQVEPGSGSTIMGYAGITPSDVQAHSDPYFHAVSIQQITSNIKTKTCQTNTPTGNAVPTANAGSNYSIPNGTAFLLSGTGADANASDVLTYCWEQMNQNYASTSIPSPTNTTGVAFRSFSPTTSNKRFVPMFSTVLSGVNSSDWEKVPTVGRALNFRFTVRDNVAGGANNKSDNMSVTVKSAAGPFAVTSYGASESWATGESKTITWNVAGTTANGINTNNVKISIVDLDGSELYVLAASTANDGSENITVPNITNDSVRIMVSAVGNIFYAINSADLAINSAVASCNTYCASEGTMQYDTRTTLVDFNTLNNATPGSKTAAYNDYTAQSTTVQTGVSYNLTVNVNTDGSYKVVTKVWIDWNKDCDFDDANEEYDLGEAIGVADGATSLSPLSITVPNDAAIGATRMRVGSKYTSALVYATSCQTGYDGEVEDYTIVVSATASVNSNNVFNGFVLSPNPNNGNFNINLNSIDSKNVTVSVYDMIGRQIFSNKYDNNQVNFNKNINLGSIKSGVYLVNVTDGVRSNSEKIIIK